MKTLLDKYVLTMVLLAVSGGLSAFADAPVFSGSLDCAAHVGKSAEPAAESSAEASALRYGFEEFANLRMSARSGEFGKVYAAVNVRAFSEFDAPAEVSCELERLYGAFRFDSFDVEAGLFRLAFGFGQNGAGFRPTDVFSTGNPLDRNARPKGVAGARIAWYPADFAKLQAFSVDAGSHALMAGSLRNLPATGASFETHASYGSMQVLALFHPAHAFSADPAGRAGISLKTDLIAAWTCEALVLLDSARRDPYARIEAAVGADYSIADGKALLSVQAYHSGERDIDLGTATAIWRSSDYTTATISATTALEDGSTVAYASASHEPFQGSTISASFEIPLDESVLGGSKIGRLGPETSGKEFSLAVALGFKF